MDFRLISFDKNKRKILLEDYKNGLNVTQLNNFIKDSIKRHEKTENTKKAYRALCTGEYTNKTGPKGVHKRVNRKK